MCHLVRVGSGKLKNIESSQVGTDLQLMEFDFSQLSLGTLKVSRYIRITC